MIIDIKNLRTHFAQKKKWPWEERLYLKAVDGVSLRIERGATLGLVGESGCGKTTLGKSILGLYPQSAGEILYYPGNGSRVSGSRTGDSPKNGPISSGSTKDDALKGDSPGSDSTGSDSPVGDAPGNGQRPVNLLDLSPDEQKSLRKTIQIIFQDPYSSLNPRLTVRDIIMEGMIIHRLFRNTSERLERVYRLLDSVGLSRSSADKYPHEFSGGQRQRIGVARALALSPEFIVCDEPVSALDVSVQAQILNLLQELQKKFDLTYLFISHDLSVVKHISDAVAVMYLGRIVEYGRTEDIFENASHPYTCALLSAIPGAEKGKRIILGGDVPSPLNPPSGCYFHPRCPEAREQCSRWEYRPSEIGEGHRAYCVMYE